MQIPGFRICQVATISFYTVKAHTHSFACAECKGNFLIITDLIQQRIKARCSEYQKYPAIVGLARQIWIAVVMAHQASCKEILRMPKLWQKRGGPEVKLHIIIIS